MAVPRIAASLNRGLEPEAIPVRVTPFDSLLNLPKIGQFGFEVSRVALRRLGPGRPDREACALHRLPHAPLLPWLPASRFARPASPSSRRCSTRPLSLRRCLVLQVGNPLE